MVVGDAAVLQVLNVAVQPGGGIRPRSRGRRAGRGEHHRLLIEIAEDGKFHPAIADVGDFKHQARSDFLLDPEVPLLYIWCPLVRVLRFARDRGRIDHANIDEAGWYARLQPQARIGGLQVVAAGNIRVAEDDERKIEAEQSFPPGAVGVIVEDAVASRVGPSAGMVNRRNPTRGPKLLRSGRISASS